MEKEFVFQRDDGWVRVNDGPIVLLGRLVMWHHGFNMYEQSKNRVLEDVRRGKALELLPAFEFLVQIVQTPNGALAKMPNILPFDILTEPTSVYIKATGVLFLDDLSPQSRDWDAYKGLVDRGLTMYRNARLMASGLVPPEAGPPGTIVPGR